MASETVEEKLTQRDSKHSYEAREVVPSRAESTLEVDEKLADVDLPPPPNLTPEQEKRLYRKIDLRLMPILTLMYLCSFLDRSKSFQRPFLLVAAYCLRYYAT